MSHERENQVAARIPLTDQIVNVLRKHGDEIMVMRLAGESSAAAALRVIGEQLDHASSDDLCDAVIRLIFLQVIKIDEVGVKLLDGGWTSSSVGKQDATARRAPARKPKRRAHPVAVIHTTPRESPTPRATRSSQPKYHERLNRVLQSLCRKTSASDGEIRRPVIEMITASSGVSQDEAKRMLSDLKRLGAIARWNGKDYIAANVVSIGTNDAGVLIAIRDNSGGH